MIATWDKGSWDKGSWDKGSWEKENAAQRAAQTGIAGQAAASHAATAALGSGPKRIESTAGLKALLGGERVTKKVLGEGLPVLHLLIVDEDDLVRGACAEIADKMGFAVVSARDMRSAQSILKHRKVDLLLLDLKVASGGGLALLEEVKTLYPDTSVIVMTAFATVASAVEAMRVGAGDYLTKPFALEELTTVLERAAARTHLDEESRRLRERLRGQKGSGHLIGRSPEMEKMYRILSKVAHSTHPVLLLGESGTDKELVARSIHFNGAHAQKPFVPVDCGSLAPELLEGELFGYVKGAVLGPNRSLALKAKEGLLAAAAGGTVFLDEVAELTLDLQAKLLRALQSRSVQAVGGTQTQQVSVRLLAATNRDLAAMVEQGRFRRDLYFRLNVVNLRIPALRDRKDDIPLLVEHFLERTQRETGVKHSFSDDALRTVMAYDWPGNVRELEAAVERACSMSSGPTVHMGDLPTQLQDLRMHGRPGSLREGLLSHASESSSGGREELEGEGAPAKIVPISEMERNAILGTIRKLNGDKLMAAKLLGIGKTTLYRKLKEYGFTEGLQQ